MATLLILAAWTEVALSIAKIGFFLVALLMILAILLQEGKGGGLAALGGTRAEQVVGATNPIRRFTVYLAVFFFLLAGFIAWTQKQALSADGLPGDGRAPAVQANEDDDESPAEGQETAPEADEETPAEGTGEAEPAADGADTEPAAPDADDASADEQDAADAPAEDAADPATEN
jgi:protein translocase SecG subunit